MRNDPKLVHIDISGFEHNVIYSELRVEQKMEGHHDFSFIWQYTGDPVILPGVQAKAAQNYIGSEVIFTFNHPSGIRLMSKGIINGIASIDTENNSPEGLHITGVSHTICLDEMKRSRTYLDKDLATIVKSVFDEGPGDFYDRPTIIPTYTPYIAYMPQSNETNFEFLTRLAKRYGQWFYSDGMRMQFGQLKTSKVTLVNGVSLHHFKIETKLVSHKAALGGYDYNTATTIRKSSAKTATGSGDGFAVAIGHRQGAIAQPDLNVGNYTEQAPDSHTLNEMVQLQTNGSNANSVFYSGMSDLPLGIGQKFTLQNKSVEHHLLVIEAIHHSKVRGLYNCEFRAIPSDVPAPHYTDVHAKATAGSQPAQVMDNNDPEGMGRIRVYFHWGNSFVKSDWMRVLQPYAGGGRGFYGIPEIDDEVIVDFENGNAERPYAIGSHYNGKAKSGYATEKNDIKAFHTRSGCKIVLNDATGDASIESEKGQTIAVVSGDGNITLKAPKNIIFEAGEDVCIKAGKNVTINSGENISETAGVNKSTIVGGILNTRVEGDSMLFVKGKHAEYFEKDFESTTKKDRNVHSGKMDIQGNDHIKVNGDKKIDRNSGEGTKDS